VAVRRRQPKQKRWRSLAERPAHTAESDALNKNFKPRGFKTRRLTIISALMQATGMVTITW
jgi:DNA-3-methyladenine glycosylase I